MNWSDRPEHLRYNGPRKYADWELKLGSKIVALEDYHKELEWHILDNELQGFKPEVACTSGGWDPIHPGHISSIMESINYGDLIVVIVNGDDFLTRKKGKPFQDQGKPFQDLKTRCQIVSAIQFVDFVIPFEIKDDNTVCQALEIIKPDYFTKGGGDRKDPSSIPEWDVCQSNNTQVVFNVGELKYFLNDWGKFFKLGHIVTSD